MKRTLFAILLLAAMPLFAADLSGRFEPGTQYEAPAAHAPENVSRMFTRTLTREQAKAVDLPAAGGSSMIIWTIPARRDARGRALSTRLTTPTGAMLRPGDRGSLERGLRRFELDAAETAELGLPHGAHEVIHVMQTAAASYRLEVDMPEDVAGVTVVAAEPNSPITLTTWAAPLSRQPGQPVTLHAELRDGASGIAEAAVTARLASPRGKAFEEVTLTHKGDGVYEATLPELPADAPGAWQVRFDAAGRTAEGVQFARAGLGELVAERGAARLDASSVRASLEGDALRIEVKADVKAAGTYRLDAIVAGPENTAVAWAEGVRRLEVGETTLTIEIPRAHLGGAAREDLALDLRLLGLDSMGVAGVVKVDLN